MNQRLRDILAWAAWAGILLVLSVRMTLLEVTVRATTRFSVMVHGRSVPTLHFPGPSEIIASAIAILVLVSVAILATTELSRFSWWLLAMIAAITVWGAIGMFDAANRFAALTGLFDAGMGLLAGWGASILCRTDRHRGFLVAVIGGLLMMLCVKAFYQRYVEIPATIHFFYQHPGEYARQMGWKPDSPAINLFVGRLNSKEVTDYFNLSDAFAEAMCPLLMVSAALVIGLLAINRRDSQDKIANTPTSAKGKIAPSNRSRGKASVANRDIPMPIFLAVCLGILLLAGMFVVILTKSKGGLASACLCLVVLAAAWRWRMGLSRHRRHAMVLLIMLVLVGAVTMLAWGFHFQSLPTKSLKFRWEYWTGAAAMIVRHPMLGVGLNNFGYYYTRYKLPSAPEDVKNPHSLLVRVASEMGLPAAVLWAALIAIYISRVLQVSTPAQNGEKKIAPISPIWLAAFVLLWWVIRTLIHGIPAHSAGYIGGLAVLYGSAALLGMILTNLAWTLIRPEHRVLVSLAAVLGAGGMLLYDQVNMAQVTSSVAMLFWVVLGGNTSLLESQSGTSSSANTSARTDRRRLTGTATLGTIGLVAAMALTVTVWIPIVHGTMRWDPATYQREFRMRAAKGDWAGALQAAQSILKLDKRSQIWLHQIINLKIRLGEDPAAQVEEMFALNRADARFRVDLVKTAACGLTPQQRLAQLYLALKLNAQLPASEPARFTLRQLKDIHELIKRLHAETLKGVVE